MSIARAGCVQLRERCPAIDGGIVARAVAVNFAEIKPAENDHFRPGPDGGVLAAAAGRRVAKGAIAFRRLDRGEPNVAGIQQLGRIRIRGENRAAAAHGALAAGVQIRGRRAARELRSANRAVGDAG